MLVDDVRPRSYGCKPRPDGSYEISIPVGLRRIVLGYEVDRKQGIIFVNYLKWDWFREALDWTVGLLGNEPGGKR